MKHAILGAGGVGGLIGACLAHSGDSVTMVVRPESLAKFPEQLQLESAFGNFTVPVARASTVPAADVLWITVKATQLDSALATFNNAEAIGAIVPLLNGIDHLAMLRARYGAGRVIAATIAVESERIAPGHIVQRTPFARLNVASAGRNQLGAPVAGLQKMGFECRFIDDEATLMWSKIVFLAPFALTTSAADRTTGAVIADPDWKRQLESSVREACAVAVAEGAKVDADAIIASMLKMPPNMRSSMQKDVERGNAPELDAIAGPILRGGARHGIAVPATRQLVAAVEPRAPSSHSLL
jgi:2-dehydropantoate 2-reductase